MEFVRKFENNNNKLTQSLQPPILPTQATGSMNKSTNSVQDLQVELSRVYDRSIDVMEQKIHEQQNEIKSLKQTIDARDQTIAKMQKELLELKNLREREKSSGEVVSDLAQSIRTNVDSGFKNVQDSNGVDLAKLITEVKKELAMSFLKDFKEAKQSQGADSKFTFSTLMASKATLPTEKPPPNASAPPQTTPISSNNPKFPLDHASAPLNNTSNNVSNNTTISGNANEQDSQQIGYYSGTRSNTGYEFANPYTQPYPYIPYIYDIPPRPQPSAPSFGGNYQPPDHTKHT